MIIGLTIVAIGTSLPELAASFSAARKNEPDLVLGNVLGSNLFNTLMVVGISGVIAPTTLDSKVIFRDVLSMTALTMILFLFGYSFTKSKRRINCYEGLLLVLSYCFYLSLLI